MSLEEKLEGIVARHLELAAALGRPEAAGGEDFVRLSKEYADLSLVVEAIQALRGAVAEIEDLRGLADDPEGEAEVRTLAEEEIRGLTENIPGLEERVRALLLPRDEADEKNAILEVRAGTGGEEAALFAADLFRMYQRFAESHGWRFETMGISETGIGGYKEVAARVTGRGVFARLKFESGVHRVQRVPETESGGRIHTSVATVAVLPEAEEVDVIIGDNDLRIDVYRASGPGGQSVNTTDSAVRITHVPTGLVVIQQDEKSQHKNKAKAMTILRARLYEAERARRDAERAETRRSQVGSGDRSQRIRTYNFPQGRVTDHRIGLTLHKLEKTMDGDLDELVDALTTEDQAARLADTT
ncbi:MAG TPA: peptide chain release factor 1 [Rhodospirillales bacterium]|nr:peptide chain release factor 1 [Rhodospirillales bacterium]